MGRALILSMMNTMFVIHWHMTRGSVGIHERIIFYHRKGLLVLDTEHCFLNQHSEKQTSRGNGSQAGTEFVKGYKKRCSTEHQIESTIRTFTHIGRCFLSNFSHIC
jgi:hypothetical protein